MTDADGVSYWKEIIANHIEDQTGREPKLVVVRIPKELAGELSPDTLGARDSGRGAYYASRRVGRPAANALAPKK